MSEAAQLRLLVAVEADGALAWQIADDSARYDRGRVATWPEIRGVELRAGIARVVVQPPRGADLDALARAAVARYGWEVAPAALAPP